MPEPQPEPGREQPRLDPWGSTVIDYSKVFTEFGISRFEELLPRVKEPHLYMRRRIIMGHRDYELILDAMERRRPFAVMSGFMPSGKLHLGGKMVMDEIIWHQRMGAAAFVSIADMEAHAVRGISWRECKEIGVSEYVLSLIALGFDPHRGFIYFQSENRMLHDLAFELGCEVNIGEMSAVYGFSGDVNVSKCVSVLMQSADILQPQLAAFGGPKPTVIPVGFDQDPHIRLTRDIASRARLFTVELVKREKDEYECVRVRAKTRDAASALKEVSSRLGGEKRAYEMHVDVYGEPFEEVERVVREAEIELGGYGFYPPAATFHRFMRGLGGGKMSSSKPESYIALTEPPEEAAAKVMNAKTGGRATLEEQRKLGGVPEECIVYELLMFHLIEDDRHVAEVYEECISGRRTCAACKKAAAELMLSFLKEHQERREEAKDVLKELDYGKKWLEVVKL
ncbi:MAG: Tryptophanyl-tRNA synthetase [Candidatus Alkanophagales archaeon MCA70_species_1]|nr:Tryptophanyl-tRNA synthetase [Candidatus Alkanophaga volatiphilum]